MGELGRRLLRASAQGLKAWRLLPASWILLSAVGPLVPARAANSASVNANLTMQGFTGVKDLFASTGSASGSVQLTWTEPTGAGVTLPTFYDIRVSTEGQINTNAEFNAAPPLSSFSASAIPSPGFGGTSKSFEITDLAIGVTHYFAIREYDSSTPELRGVWYRSVAQNWNPNNFAVPKAQLLFDIKNLVGSSGFKSAILCWDDLTPAQKGSSFTGYDIYRSLVFPPTFGSIGTSATTCYTDSAVQVGTTYYYQVTGQLGVFETLPSSTVAVYIRTLPPTPPIGIGIAVTSGSATLSWLPVYSFENGYGFATSSAPAADELIGYRVYRATSPIQISWSQAGAVSSATLTWTDLSAAAPMYYAVRAVNLTEISRPSVIRAYPGREGIVVLPDGWSMLEMSGSVADEALGVGAPTTQGAYDIFGSSKPQDITTQAAGVGKVLKSLEVWPMAGGVTPSYRRVLSGLSRLKLHYETTGGLVAPSSLRGAAPASSQAVPQGVIETPENISVYWYNGTRWQQLYGKLDSLRKMFLLDTVYFGRYQLRSVERVGGFNVDVSGLSNRILTPNGDGKNDTVVVVFDNPRDSSVGGKIIDLKGASVASMTQGPVANSLQWDGKASNGNVVPGGVYIYQIDAEGKIFNGTVVVIK
ncbi:MAG: gliding motility-associated C-terminal domain-containing protein [Elusimicrobia bacterium]|nr:gliding motility-associated C-terminal domain-containing protein [Elusimicrobiota bacterium]